MTLEYTAYLFCLFAVLFCIYYVTLRPKKRTQQKLKGIIINKYITVSNRFRGGSSYNLILKIKLSDQSIIKLSSGSVYYESELNDHYYNTFHAHDDIIAQFNKVEILGFDKKYHKYKNDGYEIKKIDKSESLFPNT